MESMSPIPPDPYEALGLTKDCKPTDIKVAYRKLALKWHPDKVAENQKDRAQEEFHKVQQAYEILSDEDKRQHYDASIRLAELRRINLEMRSANAGLRVDTRSTGGGYETRTAVPSSAVPPRGPVRSYTTDERTRPNYYSDEDIPRSSARRPDYSYVRRSPRERESDRDREKARQKEREYEDRERRDAQRRAAEKARDTERGYDRSAKGDRLREEEASRDADRRRRERDTQESRRPSLYREEEQQLRAESYIASSRRPAPASRTSSSREYAYVRPRQTADSSDRRSPPRERERPLSSRRDPEIVNDRGGRAPPPLRKTDSEPNPLASMVSERPDPHRANTTQTDYDRRRRTSLDDEKSTPSLPRSTTMPIQPNGSAKVHAPSRLRESESYSSSSSRVKTYSVDETNGATLRDPTSSTKDSSYRTLLREPGSSSRSAASGSQKPSLSADTKSGARTAHMMADLASPSPRTPTSSSSTYSSYQDRRPTYATTESSRNIRSSRSPERESRDRETRRSRADERPLYGEIGRGTPAGTPGYSRDPMNARSYFDARSGSGSGNYSRRFDNESVKYSEGRPRGSREGSYNEERPGLSRSSTAVY